MFDHEEYRKEHERQEALKIKIERFTGILMKLKPGQAEKLIEDDYADIEKMKEPNSQADEIFEEAEKSFREAEQNKDPWLGKYTIALQLYCKAVKLYREAGDAKGETKALEVLYKYYCKLDEKSADKIQARIKKIRNQLTGED